MMRRLSEPVSGNLFNLCTIYYSLCAVYYSGILPADIIFYFTYFTPDALNLHNMDLVFRTIPEHRDIERVREIVDSTKFFYDHEVEIAAELVAERLEGGEATGYFFVFAELDGKTVAYSCFGPISMSRTSFDLYWIAAHNDYRGKGIGRMVMEETCRLAREMGCSILIAETSGLPHYEPTRAFYINNGYVLEASLKDFYAMGDDKLFYTKRI